MDDLVTWLRAQLDARERELDEDERVAREADGFYDDRDLAAELIAVGFDPELAEQAARWDPARALARVATERADVDTKRRILDLHEAYESEQQGGPACCTCGPGRPYPCVTLCLLALPHAGRDGWREEWRP